MRSLALVLALVAALALAGAPPAPAATPTPFPSCTPPNVFVPMTVADANAVNTNFTAIANCVNTLATSSGFSGYSAVAPIVIASGAISLAVPLAPSFGGLGTPAAGYSNGQCPTWNSTDGFFIPGACSGGGGVALLTFSPTPSPNATFSAQPGYAAITQTFQLGQVLFSGATGLGRTTELSTCNASAPAGVNVGGDPLCFTQQNDNLVIAVLFDNYVPGFSSGNLLQIGTIAAPGGAIALANKSGIYAIIDGSNNGVNGFCDATGILTGSLIESICMAGSLAPIAFEQSGQIDSSASAKLKGITASSYVCTDATSVLIPCVFPTLAPQCGSSTGTLVNCNPEATASCTFAICNEVHVTVGGGGCASGAVCGTFTVGDHRGCNWYNLITSGGGGVDGVTWSFTRNDQTPGNSDLAAINTTGSSITATTQIYGHYYCLI